MFRNPFDEDFSDETPDLHADDAISVSIPPSESTVSLSALSTIESQISAETKKHSFLARASQIPFYPIILAFSITDAGRFVRSLGSFNEPFRYTVTALGLGTSLALSYKTLTNMQNTAHLIATRTPPANITTLSTTKKTAILSAALLTVCYLAISEVAKGKLYAYRMPSEYHFTNLIADDNWFIVSSIVAGVAGIGGVLNEGHRTCHNYGELVTKKPVNYANKISGVISPLLGYGLAPFAAFNDFVSGFTANALIYNANKPGIPTYTFAALALGASGIHGYLNAKFTRDNINLFFKHAPENYKKTDVVVSFAVTLAISTLLSFALFHLTKELSNIALKDLEIEPNTVYDPIITMLSFIAAINRLIVFTANIYPTAHSVVDHSTNIFSKTQAKIANCSHSSELPYTFSNKDQELAPVTRIVAPENTLGQHQTPVSQRIETPKITATTHGMFSPNKTPANDDNAQNQPSNTKKGSSALV